MAAENQNWRLTEEEQAQLKQKVINIVRGVLMPEKHGMPLDKLNRK